MRNIVFYITGHGYGHATRSIELVRALMEKAPQTYFHIKSDAPEWLFSLNLPGGYSFHSSHLDVGAVQKTSFVVEKDATLVQWLRFLDEREVIVDKEVKFLEEVQPEVVIGDIPPVAFDVAARARVPGVAVANFSWDWIYRDYSDELPEFARIIDYIRSAYGHARLLLRLPFHGDLSAFHRIRDIPLIARKAIKPREEVRKLLEIEPDTDKKLVLVALRASDMAITDVRRAFAHDNVLFITFGLDAVYGNQRNVPPDFMRFADLVNACDLVISKPGYGIVSEIIANQVPLLYTSRQDFAEYSVLVEGLQEYAVSQLLPYGDFVAGKWQNHISEILERTPSWPAIGLDGAARAADEILSVANAALGA